MKPTSIVSLVLAVVIIVIGVVTCAIANNMANKSGTPLFAETRGDDTVATVPLSKDTIKISLDITDADVFIYGSTTESYMELVNFRETFYSLNKTNTSVSFNEVPNITSMFKFWENGVSFKGMRHILSLSNFDNAKKKQIFIYLTADSGIKQFDITAENATVTLENLSCTSDYIIKANQISLYSSSVATNSSLKINSGNGAAHAEKATVTLKDSKFTNVQVKADELNFESSGTYSENALIECKSGSVDWRFPENSPNPDMKEADPSVSISTLGKILFNDGEEIMSYIHKSAVEEPRSITITAVDADISLNVSIVDQPAKTESNEPNE